MRLGFEEINKNWWNSKFFLSKSSVRCSDVMVLLVNYGGVNYFVLLEWKYIVSGFGKMF